MATIELIECTGAIVCAYVSNNPVPASELPALIARVHATLLSLGGEVAVAAAVEVGVAKPTAAQIRKSLTDDGIVSFLDGKTYKILKRHLTTHGLDPRSYRERYGLPDGYPMVAPGYAARRSELAKAIGLGGPRALAGGARKQSEGRSRHAP
ncbi:MucR family transcriptional regulator [Methylobacterium gregans]|uniref:Transcriptional regulatory protein ros n=1 Tax=Methylobacterium gregans TaxID=374424 RepID=A0AA37M9Z6_9HYPH|nr:MucR family transcriptional regulator [Methylobacterium gregans]MDQ0518805.1 putative transcriptional regulator [Methylobacterium gregans]GJD77373.1 Transcriptional regulatory protein ros [Methylobacterium gregans]GLS56437.1 hypothetical protein GCM10007886_46220 [Methylobacterium gregans]